MLLLNLNLLATAPGGVAHLRELILTLAVQGKLVPQDPKDEPASLLLKKIRAEKDRLIAEGEIKRDKPLVEISEEEKPFALPVDWEWVRLPEVTYNLGQGAPIEKFTYIDVASIDNEKGLVADTAETVEAVDAPSRARKNVAVGTVLYSTIRPYLKNIAVVEKDYAHRAIASTAFAVMHPHIGLHSKYLLHYLRSAIFTDFVSSKAVGVAYPAINDANFFEGVIAIPPMQEQSRIVTRVEELMRLCDALEAKGQFEATQHEQLIRTMLATLTDSETPAQLTENWHRIATHFDLLLDHPEAVDALEQTILQLAVRGLLVPQDPQDEPAGVLLKKIRAKKDKLIAGGKIKRDNPLPPIAEDEQPFALPQRWEWVPIETLADVGTGTTPSRDNVAFFTDGSIPWVTSGETGKPFIAATAQHVTELALAQTSLSVYPVGTLIVAMYGQGKTRGQVSELQIEAATNQACAAIVLIEPSIAHRSFIKLVFEKSYDQMRELSAGGAQPNLNVGKIKSTLMPLPPLAEQSRIVTRVAQLRRLCSDLRQRLTASQSTQAHLAEALVQDVV